MLSEIGFVLPNFLCLNVQTSVGREGVRTKFERPNFLRLYHPGLIAKTSTSNKFRQTDSLK